MSAYPKRARKTIVLEYWDCGVCTKLHQIKSRAEQCISKHEKERKRGTGFKWTKDILQEIVNRKARGETVASIARAFGKNPQTIKNRIWTFLETGECVDDSQEITKQTSINTCGLRPELQSRLMWAGIKTVGDLFRVTDESLMQIPSVGAGSIREINELRGRCVDRASE